MNKKLLSLLSLALLFTASCTDNVNVINNSGENQTAAFNSFDGVLKSRLTAPIDKTFKATNAALDKLGYLRVGQNTKSLTKKIIYARGVQDYMVEVRLIVQKQNITDIQIYYGNWGDLAKSQEIYNEIAKILKQTF